jgi:hypothetical protein
MTGGGGDDDDEGLNEEEHLGVVVAGELKTWGSESGTKSRFYCSPAGAHWDMKVRDGETATAATKSRIYSHGSPLT